MPPNMQQAETALAFFEQMKLFDRPDGIIEFGTGWGGLIAALGRMLPEASIVTYDIVDRRKVDLPGNVKFVKTDIFAHVAELLAEIKNFDGKLLILCDNGDKVREFNTFSTALRRGDMIAVHDFASTRWFHDTYIRGRYWDYCEVVEADLDKAAFNQGLVRHPSLFSAGVLAAWGLFKQEK